MIKRKASEKEELVTTICCDMEFEKPPGCHIDRRNTVIIFVIARMCMNRGILVNKEYNV